MADKTTGELPAVPIGELPLAPDIYDDTILPVEQQGEARHITGKQWTDYAKAAVDNQVTQANAARDAAQAAQGKAEEARDAAQQSAGEAADSAEKAEQYSGKPPIIWDGNWWTWDADQQAYVDTGEPARGNLMYAAFWLDPETGDLYMYTDDEYTGPTFRLNENGDLEVLINAGVTA